MIRRDAPGPMLRRGPRPLLMHLLQTVMPAPSSLSSAARSPDSGTESSSSNPAPDAARPPERPGPERPRLDTGFLAGVAAYRRHPSARDLPDPPVLWQEGDTRLLDYGGLGGAASGEAMPALFVPSLINRGTILDLDADRSMLRWLAQRGVRPLLLEWGWPGAVERRYDLTDYIARRLEPAIAAAAASHRSGRTILLGYCMGGLLALAATQRHPELVAALGLIATPWDFHAGQSAPLRHAAGMTQRLDALIGATGTLPVDALQLAFAAIDPASIAAKFRRFASLPTDHTETRLFVAIEDWLNDGVPLAGPVARECLSGWYGDNSPARGEWRVGGAAIDPSALRLPTLVVMPQRDRIVPPEGCAALATRLRRPKLLALPGGHVGIVAGPRARELFWTPLLRWLRRIERAAERTAIEPARSAPGR